MSNSFIDKVLDLLHDSIKLKGIKVLNYIPSTTKVICIPAYVKSIMLNLVTNAIKYANPTKEPKIVFTTEQNYDFVVLDIKDNGLGIDLEKHKYSIFGLHKTFHRNNDTRGVGLYLTKNQTENMGEKIAVESTLNFSSKFNIYFKNE